MKRQRKSLVGIVALVLCVLLAPAAVQAANISVTLGTTDNASVGDTVTARIVVSNNPGISTFAVKLAYDSNYLTYTGAVWANSISGDANNVQLISEVTEDGGPVLNISSILNSTYSNNETVVTLNFMAKQNYTTMPVTLTNREITDSSYSPVTVSLLVDASAGQTSAESSESESSSGSQNNSGDSGDNNDSGSESSGSSGSSGSGSESGSSNSSSNSSGSSSGKTASGDQKLDQTPKTGALDVRLVLIVTIVVFLVISGVCMKLLGRKKRS